MIVLNLGTISKTSRNDSFKRRASALIKIFLLIEVCILYYRFLVVLIRTQMLSSLDLERSQATYGTLQLYKSAALLIINKKMT